MNKPTWKLGRIGKIKRTIDNMKEKKEAFRKFANDKCKGKRV